MDTLYAGSASYIITPQKPMFLVGYPHVNRISEGVHDDLKATALCLKSGKKVIIMIAVDILLIKLIKLYSPLNLHGPLQMLPELVETGFHPMV